jgi:hypothetical protein
LEKQPSLLEEQTGSWTSGFGLLLWRKEKNLLPLPRIETSIIAFPALGVDTIPSALVRFLLLVRV